MAKDETDKTDDELVKKPEETDVKTEAPKKTAAKVAKEEEITVKKDVLDGILKTLQEQQKELERLQYAADKGRMAKFNEKNTGEPIRRVTVNHYNGKIVMAWTTMTANEVYKDFRTGVWHEKLETKIVLSDGQEVPLVYEDFIKLPHLDCDVLNRLVGDDGKSIYKLITAESVAGIPLDFEFEIDGTFINHK